MASTDNNDNNAKGPGEGQEKDVVPTTSVGSTDQGKEEAKSGPATETQTTDNSGEVAVGCAKEKKSESSVVVSPVSSAPVLTEQKPVPPTPVVEESAIAPDTSAQASATGEPKPLPAHPTREANVGSQQTENDASAPNIQEPQPSTSTSKPSNVETQQSNTEIETAPAEQSTHTAHEEQEDAGPSVTITLLLTTGARHPFRINARYLRKRSIEVPDHDPFKMSVYTLKELILREWRAEWENRPTSPSAIRLIFFGKLLEDKSPISEYKFNHGAPNVVHMTVKPQELMDEEDAKTAKSSHGRDREANESSPGCRCVIL